jgi:hypothetical protein
MRAPDGGFPCETCEVREATGVDVEGRFVCSQCDAAEAAAAVEELWGLCAYYAPRLGARAFSRLLEVAGRDAIREFGADWERAGCRSPDEHERRERHHRASKAAEEDGGIYELFDLARSHEHLIVWALLGAGITSIAELERRNRSGKLGSVEGIGGARLKRIRAVLRDHRARVAELENRHGGQER